MSKTLPVERKHNLLTKAEEETLPNIGKSPRDRDIFEKLDRGVINLDKVGGPTSHEVVSWVKKIFNKTNVFKTAHGGTLDPKVTGVLPTALNRAVRAIDVLLTAGKEYICIMKMHGGEVESKVRTAIKHFEGKIYQRPPVRAAVKRTLRVREIYYIDILEIDQRKVLFRVGCEAGTYIRKLCYDIGEVLGCGAHMEELRRTQSGPFKEDDSLVTLQDVSDAVYYWIEENDSSELERIVKSMETIFSHVPKVIIRDSAVDPICHGANLTAPGILKFDADIHKKDDVAIFTQKGEILALGSSLATSREIMEAKSGILVNTTRVFIEPGTYPKWVKKSE